MSDKPTYSFGGASGGGGSAGNSGGGIFGNNTSSSGTSSPSLFGSSSKPPASGGLFGSASTGNTGPGLFGSTSQAAASGTPQPSGLFGGGSQPASSPFSGLNAGGGATPTTSGAPSLSFGGFSTPNKDEASSGKPSGQSSAPPQNSIFGATTSAGGGGGGLFPAAAPTGTNTPAQNKTFSFGNPSTTPAGNPPSGGQATTSLFGAKSSEPAKPGLFGAASTGQTPSSSASAGNLFGGAGTSAAPSGNLFGSKPAGSAGQSAATQAPTTQSTPASSTNTLLGNANKGPPSTTQGQPDAAKSVGLFGSVGQPATTTSQSSTKSLFSGTPQAPATTGPPQPTLLFGTAPNPAATPASSSQAASNIFDKPNFQLGSKQPTSEATPSSSAPTTSGAAPTPTFSLGGAAAASQPNLFSMGQSKPDDKPAGSSAAPAFGSNLFSTVAKPSEAPKPAGTSGEPVAGVTSTTEATYVVPPAAVSNPLASTAGPKPTPQSRLKNKSMDEIITRWATDLTKYQKEFRDQAQKVANWDRLLVENSDKIMKLYGSTLEAERATTEVERQLAAVENDQAELEYWLDHYEKQVDEIMSSQGGSGESLSGPDQERERTYKLAEKLSDRIDEMTKDLNNMVEEINSASSQLSQNSKPDDPLSQIVRVLNGHLSQLQQIDQGTAALQAKVHAAQKATRSFGAASGSGIGNDSVNDFYRSYTRGR